MGKDFPVVKWGICPACGAKGADQTSDLSSADAPARNTGNGVKLETYQGKLMCEICKKEAKANNESEIAAVKHNDKERFLAGAGFGQ